MQWGVMLGSIANEGIKTYGDMLKLKQATQDWQDQQAERAAAQNAGNDQATPTTDASGQGSQQILQGIQGNSSPQDPEAAMQGLIGVKTAANPAAAQAAMSSAQTMQQASDNANPQQISVPAPNQPVPTAASMGIGQGQAAPATGAPAGQMTTPTPAGGIAQAIAGQESNNNPNSPTSVNGAVGKFQITPGTFHAFAKPGENINNPTDNQNVGERIIAKYAQDYNNDPKKVAVAYFSGPGNVNNDPNAKTPYIHDYKDGNGKSTSSYVQDVTRRLGQANTVNSYAGGTNDDGSEMAPLTPDTKLTMLKATALPESGIADNQNYQFKQDPQSGQITMQPTVNPAQRAMAAANEAYKRGDMKNAGALMQSAMTIQTQQMQQKVNGILNNPQLSQDEKVAQLGQLSGSKVYKAENGSYIVPGLGPSDANGNPAPMSYQQVASFAQWMTSPEGMHYAMDYNMQAQQLKVSQQNANTEQRKEAVNEALAPGQQAANIAEKQASTEWRRSLAGNVQAQADLRITQAQNEQEWNNIQKQVKDLGAQQAAGKITPEQYKMQIQNLNDQAAVLKNRMGVAGTGSQKEAAPEKMEPGQMYRMPDGSMKVSDPQLGLVDPEVSQNFQRNQQIITTNTSFADYPVDRKTGLVGLPPGMAKQAGLNPNALYKTPQQALAAFQSSPQISGQHYQLPSTPNLPAQIGIPTAG